MHNNGRELSFLCFFVCLVSFIYVSLINYFRLYDLEWHFSTKVIILLVQAKMKNVRTARAVRFHHWLNKKQD